MNHEIIRNVYPNAHLIYDEDRVFDIDGNKVKVDKTILAVKEAELQIEYQWNELRQQRNQLLTETDWTANSDVVMTDEMRTYRQALRDLPANTADPVNPTWPEL
jgi:hypothetical protein